jgi:hypothetical protein
MKKTFLSILVLCCSISSFAQQIIGKIIDNDLQEPIPFVNIQLSDSKGTISNNEGVYRLDVEGYEPSHLVTFSSMGFEELQISIQELQQNSDIVLTFSNEVLDQVFVTNKELSALEIIEKFKENRAENHQLGQKRYRLFYRDRQSFKPEQMIFELKKATNLTKKARKQINKSMLELNDDISGSTSLSFYESLRDLYIQDTTLVDLKKKIYLADSDAKKDVEEYQEQAIMKLFQNFDSEYGFKVKLGLITLTDSVEMNTSENSVSIGTNDEDDWEEEDSAEENDTIAKKKKISPDLSIERYPELAYTKGQELPDVLEEIKWYDYELLEPTIVKGRQQYVIRFEPGRRKGKFEGKMYIDREDFALTQIDYKLAEGKSVFSLNLKLLGFEVDVYKAEKSIRFTKTDEGFYVPYYASRSQGGYVFLRRTLTFIENNPNRKERIKFKLRFIIEVENEETSEWVLLEQENIEGKTLDSSNFAASLETETVETYSPEIWKDYPIFEATKEMKQYNFKE